MSFCKFSAEFVANNKTEIDNIFINEYLPFAQPEFVKVYIYGLYLCGCSTSFENNLENFAKTLGLTEDDVKNSFTYWQEQGLVQILSTSPIEVRFVPIKNALNSVRLFNTDKYSDFNRQAIVIFEGKRSISKTEFGEYYDFLESSHMEHDSLIMIMNYCVMNKNSTVGYNYILTVAKNWAKEGILSTAQVEEKLNSFNENNDNLNEILSTLGKKRGAYIEERNLVNKWMQEFGFELGVILYIAKKLKKMHNTSFETLDAMLTKYYEMSLLSTMEIDKFEENKKELYVLAKNINKALGIYYESLDSEVELYINKWLNYGFEAAVLYEIATYCFKNSIRKLEGMDGVIYKFYKLGIVSMNALNEYISDILSVDNKIKSILDKLGIVRRVNIIDRENYNTWINSWKLSEELIDYACTLATGKQVPMQYLNKILASWHEQGIKTKAEAEKMSIPGSTNSQPKSNENFKGRSYTRDELNAFFQNIDEIEL